MSNTISFHTSTTDGVMTLTIAQATALLSMLVHGGSPTDVVSATQFADLRAKLEAFVAAAT